MTASFSPSATHFRVCVCASCLAWWNRHFF